MFTKDNYDDIIHLPHHVSPTRPPMPMRARAAQFTPFAAVRGMEMLYSKLSVLQTGKSSYRKKRKPYLTEKCRFLCRYRNPIRKSISGILSRTQEKAEASTVKSAEK